MQKSSTFDHQSCQLKKTIPARCVCTHISIVLRIHKNPRITSYGLNTNAIFGFTTTLLEVLEKYDPTHIAVCFDHKSENIRKQEYPLYKANRDETPEDIKRSEPFIRQIIEAFNIPILEKEGYEADDVIVTLATIAEKKDSQRT